MNELNITCPHCEVQISIEIDDEPLREVQDFRKKNEDFFGFVFQCPQCSSPISYQADGGEAVELDNVSFDNFKKAVEKSIPMHKSAHKISINFVNVNQTKNLDSDVFDNMLKDIRESDSFDDFLNRIGSSHSESQ